MIFSLQLLLEPVEVLVVSPESPKGLGGFTGLLPEAVQGLPDLGLVSGSTAHLLDGGLPGAALTAEHLVEVGGRHQLEVAAGVIELGLIWRRRKRN